MKCYGLTTNGTLQQEWYETYSKDAAKRARQLRKSGYKVSVSAMGHQFTSVGAVKMSLLTITNRDEKIPPVDEIININI